MKYWLAHKRPVIIGGTAGMGLSATIASIEEGAKLVTAGRDPEHVKETNDKLKNNGFALVTKDHLAKSRSKRSDAKRLSDFADLVLDSGAPVGDSMIIIDGLQTPVSPGSTVGGGIIINSIKAEVAGLLTEAGK